MATKRRKCENNPDVLHLWKIRFAKEKRKDYGIRQKAYLSYFGVKLGDQDKPWAPHLACRSCVEHLRE